MTRRVYQMIELRQKRCTNRFGIGEREPDQTPDLTKSDGDTVISTEVDRQSSIMAVFDVTFAAEPDGIIWEQGAAVTGLYLGVTNGLLTLRAGEGSAIGTAQTAAIRRQVAPLAGLTARVIAEVLMPATVRLTVINGDGVVLMSADGSAPNGDFPLGEWAGGNEGGIGEIKGGLVVAGESVEPWNGTLSEARFYEGEFPLVGCAATGTPKCYQSFATCGYRSAYNLDGLLRWRFVPTGQPRVDLYEQDDADHFATHGYPIVKSISHRPTKLNMAASRKGESPLGIRSELRVKFNDFAFDDRDGDFYLSDRSTTPASFWGKFTRRLGAATQQLEAYHYQWYEGESYSDGIVSRFDVQSLVYNGTDADLVASDPMQRTEAKKAQFPRTTGGSLRVDIDAVQTTGIEVFAPVAELDKAYGNTGAVKFLRLSDEAIEYTGHVDGSDGARLLTGVRRAVLNTSASDHEANSAVQRMGVYRRVALFDAALDLLENHSTLSSDLIPSAQWQVEGSTYLPTYVTQEAVIPEPTDVRKLLGELARDGLFNIYWNERAQNIPLLAVKAPDGVIVNWTDRANLIDAGLDVKPDDRITRVVVLYNPRKYIDVSDEFGNWKVAYVRIDADSEGPFFADGTVRENRIQSRWITADTHALIVAYNLERRLVAPPEYAVAALDAKDESVDIGDVIEMTTGRILDSEGNPLTQRWEVIERDPIDPGYQVKVRLQLSPYEGRFANFMAADAPDYADATEEERAFGCWFADGSTLRMPNGDEPYRLR